MSEPGLSIGVANLRAEVGFLLGYGRTSGNWSDVQLTEINSLVQSGVRRVYYPPAVSAGTLAYEWSWLRPTKTLSITSGDADYDLPDDFGRLIGALYYPEGEHRSPISIVSVGKLLAMRDYTQLSDSPRFAAIRYKTSDGSAGQRQEIIFYPKPNAAWTLSYEYEAYNGALDDAHPYPLGGMQYAELYIESCLSVAEQRINNEIGLHSQRYDGLLIDAVARDMKHGAKIFGPMGHIEHEVEFRRHGDTGSQYDVVYKSVVY